MPEYTQDSTGKYTPKPLQGLGALSKEEQDKFIQGLLSEGKLPRSYSFDQADRIYKNRQFKKKYGDDVYAKITNKNSPDYIPAEARDEIFDREEYSKAIESRFSKDPNIAFYRDMTTEGLKDLWDSGIMSKEELEEEEEKLNKLRKSNPENTYKPKSRLLAAFINANEGLDADGKPIKKATLSDAADYLRLERGILQGEEKKKVEEKAAILAQQAENALEGKVSVGADEETVDQMIKRLYSSNAKRIEDLRMREDERVLNLPNVQEASRLRADQLRQKVDNGGTTLEEIAKTYHQIFDNDEKEDMSGSRYYTGYKNKAEFSDFDIDDMINTLAEFSVLSEAFGDQSRAMQVIDTKMFNYAKANQGFFKRRMNVVTGVAAKANAMLINELFGGALDLGHALLEKDPEAYRQYKTAEKALTEGGAGFLFNPNYWNYVDQYGVWNPNEIKRINDNGGIGGRQNLYSPTGKMTAEQFVDEGFKMLGYMLPGVAIGAATKKLPRGSGWAKLIAGWEVTGSALSLGSAYSTGVYNDITLKGEQALDKMFDTESSEYIKNYYNQHPDYVENYLKARGIKPEDTDILTIPTVMAAQKQLYENAKEAYFSDHKDRKAAYIDAQKRLLEDAKRGATVDNLIETGRMLVSGAFWGKWTKSKLTRDVLNRGYNPITASGEEITQASRNALRRRAAAMTVLSGGVDNWLDDITAGVGKGLGLGTYNNYLGSVYGPEATIEGAKFASNFLDGFLYGMEGAGDALEDPQTWIDGALGAAGSVLGTRINAVTLIRDLVNKEGAFSPKDTEKDTPGYKSRKEWEEMSKLQHWDRYITNGVMTSMADVDAKYSATNDYIKDLKERVIPKYREEIQNIGNVLGETIDYNLIADSILEGKDIKQMGMLKSVIRMLDGVKDPVLGQLPEVQKFTDLLSRGREGKFTYEEIQNYINDPANVSIKNAVDENGNDISTERAVEAMQKNINSFIKIADIYTKFSKGLSKSDKFSKIGATARTQMAVELTLKDLWKERFDSMQKELNTVGTEEAPWSYEAEFGSKKGQERAINALQKVINKTKEDLNKLRRDVSVHRDIVDRTSTEKDRELATKILRAIEFARDRTDYSLKENERLLREKTKATVEYDESGNARTLTATEIMRLSPRQRAYMLDPHNRDLYSEEQQKIIDRLSDSLKNHIDENGNSRDLLQVVLDAGKIQERIEGSEQSIQAASKNPYMLQLYAERLQERRNAMLTQAAMDRVREEQLEELSEVQDAQQAIEVVFRNRRPSGTASKGLYIPAEVVKEYVEKHPETSDRFAEAQDMVRTLDDLYHAAEDLFTSAEAEQIKSVIAKVTRSANSKAEMISAVEDAMDAQTTPESKMQFDRVLEKMKDYGYQRDATKVRNRDLERQRKAEAEIKLKEEESKEVKETPAPKPEEAPAVPQSEKPKEAPTRRGDKQIKRAFRDLETATTLEKKTRAIAKYETNKYRGAEVTAEEDAKINQAKEELKKEGYEIVDMLGKPYHPGMIVTANFVLSDSLAPGETKIVGVTKPQVNKDGKMVQSAEITVAQSPIEQTGVADVDIQIDSDGATASPTAAQQAAKTGTAVISIPEADATDQGNVINVAGNNVIPGNRWVEYSVDKLKDGVVQKEQPKDSNSVFSELRNWLDKTGTRLQEIIDEELSRMLQDNPDLPIKFMMMKKEDGANKLSSILFNVVELTPGMRQKYHTDSRGGVIQANGKSWLVVGTDGFAAEATREARDSYDANMKGPISKRRYSYFESHPNEHYYVDDVAYTNVQNTTSGRIVNQRLEDSESHLQKVSELLKSAGMSLKKAFFGIQTKQVGEKSFTTTKNFKDRGKLYPPRNIEDNRGRTFILIETTNGNWIPGMIEPAMYNNLKEDSPLKIFIDSTIAKLFSTNYEVRRKGISELRSYLLLSKDGNNILIGNKDINDITIKVPGKPDIKQSLGANFDALKFFNDLRNANFQINVTLDSLNDPDFLEMYDESGALMTSVASMKTAGMSYTIYPVDSSGKPIKTSVAGNSAPSTRNSDFKTYRSTRVNNVTYEYKNGEFIDRNTKKAIMPESPLWWSCLYNLEIKEGNWVPIAVDKGKEYYSVQGEDGNLFVITRDGLGNIEFLGYEETNRLTSNLAEQQQQHLREQNLEDVDFGEDLTPEPAKPTEAPAAPTQEDINRHILDGFEKSPAAEPPKVQKIDISTAEGREQLQKQADHYLDELRPLPNKETYQGEYFDLDFETATHSRERIKEGTYVKLYESDLNRPIEDLLSELEKTRNQLVEDRKKLAERRKESAGEKSSEALRGPLASIEVHLRRGAKALEVLYRKLNDAAKVSTEKASTEEAKEIQSKQPKEVISDIGTKSLGELQNTRKLSTFVDVAASEYSDRLYNILEEKGWGITGNFAKDEEILKSHGITTTGITNVESWLDMIKNCK